MTQTTVTPLNVFFLFLVTYIYLDYPPTTTTTTTIRRGSRAFSRLSDQPTDRLSRSTNNGSPGKDTSTLSKRQQQQQQHQL